MSIDFEIPDEAKAIRAKVRKWVHEECIPAEKRLVDKESFKTVLAELRAKARTQGLWLPFIPKEYGGMGLGPLANALLLLPCSWWTRRWRPSPWPAAAARSSRPRAARATPRS